MPLCTLGKAQTTDKATSEFNLPYKNETQVDAYFPWGPDSEAAWSTRTLAGVTAQGPKTVISSAVVAKVFQTNYKTDNEFFHSLIKFAMCTGRKKRLHHYRIASKERPAKFQYRNSD